MTSTMIICADGSELSLDAARQGLELLKAGERNVLLTVVETPDPALLLGASGFAGGTVTPSAFEDLQRGAEAGARDVLSDTIAALGPELTQDLEQVAITGNPGTAICAYAEENDASVIVIGSRGHGGLRRAVLGSVSDHVVRNAPCAVLILGDAADHHDS